MSLQSLPLSTRRVKNWWLSFLLLKAFFHTRTLTFSEGRFRSDVQKCLRMSQLWIIPAFMHRNRRERGQGEEKSLLNGKTEMLKGKLKESLNLEALKSL